MAKLPAKTGQARQPADARVHERILAALRDLQFGAVEIQIHDGQVVRITRIEKVRVEPAAPNGPID